MMHWQGAMAAAVVGGCFAYVGWQWMPDSLRRTLAMQSLRLPLPRRCATYLRRALQPVRACGACGGCAAATSPQAAPVQTLVFHPRKR